MVHVTAQSIVLFVMLPVQSDDGGFIRLQAIRNAAGSATSSVPTLSAKTAFATVPGRAPVINPTNLFAPTTTAMPGGKGGRRRGGRRKGKAAKSAIHAAAAKPAAASAAAPRKAKRRAALDPKWDLASATDPTSLTGRLVKGVSDGELSDEQAGELVNRLTGGTAGGGDAADLAELAHAPFLAGSSNSELDALWTGLDALVTPPMAAPALDADAVDAWFLALDSSRDGSISFLEWRDRTALPLSLFRRIDRSGEGLVAFDEFAPALLVSAARSGTCVIDPGLVDQALGHEPDVGPLLLLTGMKPKFAQLTTEETLQRARAELAAGALLLVDTPKGKAKAGAAPGKTGAAGGTGAASNVVPILPPRKPRGAGN